MTDEPAVPASGLISIQLLVVVAVQLASELMVISTLLELFVKSNVSVDAVIDAGAWRTVILSEVLRVPV
jgi:hypothetical protein